MRAPMRLLWQHAWRSYFADNPLTVSVWSTGVRGMLQAVFFVLLATRLSDTVSVAAAVLSAAAITAMGPCVLGVANVALTEKGEGTFWRIRRSRVSTVALFLAMSAPYVVMTPAFLTMHVVGCSLLLGHPEVIAHTLGYVPIYTLMAAGAAIVGTFAAAMTIAHRADVIAPNIVQYGILVLSGIFIPPGTNAFIDHVSVCVPGHHGMNAIRSLQVDGPFVQHLFVEALVSVGWLIVGCIGLQVAQWRATHHGQDDFE